MHRPQKIQIFENITLIDGTGDPPQENVAIACVDERIDTIRSTAELADLFRSSADCIDMRGCFAIPGLVESHFHFATVPNRQTAEFVLNRQLYGGVTTVRDMAGDMRALADLSRSSRLAEIEAPDIYYSALMAGPQFFKDPRVAACSAGEKAGDVPWAKAITDATDLKIAVAEAKGTGAAGIKTYASLDKSLMQRLVQEAKAQNFPVWSHAHVFPARVQDVVKLDVRSVSHTSLIAAAAVSDFMHENVLAAGTTEMLDVNPASSRIDEVLHQLAERQIIFDATLRVDVDGSRQIEKFREKSETGETRQSATQTNGTYAYVQKEGLFDIVRRAYEAGVVIATGTDSCAKPDCEFPELYDEIAYLHDDVGMPMDDVIKAATLNGAKILGRDYETGTVEPGKLANFVFLRENPLEGPKALESVELTVKRGRAYARKDFVLGTPDHNSPIFGWGTCYCSHHNVVGETDIRK